jgi:hypothetical protein
MVVLSEFASLLSQQLQQFQVLGMPSFDSFHLVLANWMPILSFGPQPLNVGGFRKIKLVCPDV